MWMRKYKRKKKWKECEKAGEEKMSNKKEKNIENINLLGHVQAGLISFILPFFFFFLH